MEQSTFSLLLQQLKQLLLIYRALFTLAEDKKQAIIKNEIEAINMIAMKETKALKPVPELESGIRALMTKLQRELGFRPKLKMTITELVQLLTDHEQKQQLAQVQEELASISEKLKQANAHNQELVQLSLEYVNFSLDVICGPQEDEITYQRPAQDSIYQKRTGMYDRKM